LQNPLQKSDLGVARRTSDAPAGAQLLEPKTENLKTENGKPRPEGAPNRTISSDNLWLIDAILVSASAEIDLLVPELVLGVNPFSSEVL